MTLRRMDDVGVVAEDLEAATASLPNSGRTWRATRQSRDAGWTVSSFTARAACVRHRRRKFVDNTGRGHQPDHADGDPRPAAVTFVTAEHFTLQGARSSTTSESTGRASVFLGAVSGGLIALGLVATAAKTGVAFYMFGLILPPTLAFAGLGDVPPGAGTGAGGRRCSGPRGCQLARSGRGSSRSLQAATAPGRRRSRTRSCAGCEAEPRCGCPMCRRWSS